MSWRLRRSKRVGFSDLARLVRSEIILRRGPHVCGVAGRRDRRGTTVFTASANITNTFSMEGPIKLRRMNEQKLYLERKFCSGPLFAAAAAENLFSCADCGNSFKRFAACLALAAIVRKN